MRIGLRDLRCFSHNFLGVLKVSRAPNGLAEGRGFFAASLSSQRLSEFPYDLVTLFLNELITGPGYRPLKSWAEQQIHRAAQKR